ncbi:TVP38/TMEM64 family protein [Lacticaseibacillus baoqingensis]|uniref:TVP38/TMEM64 family membrane protein n=1 Tax=Lacticaseibacillus baoqingensis TaxID=2486013 RepID=A0ABW4EBH0_9LACO|nr:TVP38/TMEM64 family protein [Lacticaseibacillus baoqingensis]
MEAPRSRQVLNASTLVCFAAAITVSVYWYHLGVFHDLHSLQGFLNSAGWFGPLAFILIQIIQVVIPVIPGGVSTAAGVLLFGPVAGFSYNYIGIVIGSLINFALARHYGQAFIRHIISAHTFNKYMAYTKNQRRFDRFFALAIVLPVAPDDALCLIAGLTQMSWRRFCLIIFLGKPITIAAYSWGLVTGAQWLMHWLG